ncbi:MAG: hypothetical protein ACP5IM_07975 [Candidatus Bathyarchaeia archaeon]
MGTPFQPGFLTHKHCVNFQNGTCKLYSITVNPNGLDICPNFTPLTDTQTVRQHFSGQVSTNFKVAKRSHRPPHIHRKFKSYPTKWYGYDPYYFFPFPTSLQFINTEIKMLEAYREELRDEIGALDARIRELKRERSLNWLIF